MSVEELVTAAEIAKLLNFSVRTINNWAAMGALPGAIRFGRYWRYDKRAVIDYVRQKMIESSQPYFEEQEAARTAAEMQEEVRLAGDRLRKELGLPPRAEHRPKLPIKRGSRQ